MVYTFHLMVGRDFLHRFGCISSAFVSVMYLLTQRACVLKKQRPHSQMKSVRNEQSTQARFTLNETLLEW
jgi:hypothetical protein